MHRGIRFSACRKKKIWKKIPHPTRGTQIEMNGSVNSGDSGFFAMRTNF